MPLMMMLTLWIRILRTELHGLTECWSLSKNEKQGAVFHVLYEYNLFRVLNYLVKYRMTFSVFRAFNDDILQECINLILEILYKVITSDIHYWHRYSTHRDIALRNGRFSEQSHSCKRNACKVTRIRIYFISNEYLPLSFNLV